MTNRCRQGCPNNEYIDRNWVCTGLDAAVISICQKMEHTSQKYNVPFRDVLRKVLEYHDEWETEE